MKSLLDRIVESLRDFFDSVGRARAAAELTRYGHYDAANRLINGESLI